MRTILDFFSPPIFEHDQEKTRQAGMLFRALQIAWAVPFAAVAASLLVHANTTFYLPIGIGMAIVIVAMNIMMRRGIVRPTSMAFIAILLIVSGYADFIQGGQVRNVTVLIAVTVVAAGLLLGGRAATIAATVLIIEHGAFVWAATQGLIQAVAPQATPVTNFLVVSIAYIMVAFNFAVASNSLNTALARAQKSEQELAKTNQDLEKRVTDRTTELNSAVKYIERRAKQFEAITKVSQSINTSASLQELLPYISQVVSEQFGFYHVGIFLNDINNQYANLAAANSSGGKKMLERGHQLKIGEQGIVGYTTSTGEPRIALDVGQDVVFFNNPDLPDTHSEMALPLRIGGKIEGALDIQSTESNAFSNEDVQVLSALADQVSLAIQNARLFDQTQSALAESQLLYGKVVNQTWKTNIQTSPQIGYRYAGVKPVPLAKEISTPEIHDALENGDIAVTHPNRRKDINALAVPLKLRETTIGIININLPVDAEFGEDEIDIVRAASQRIGIALENASLLEESQRRAKREQTISVMSGKIGAGTEIETILKTAVRELGAQIGGAQISIEMGSGDE